MVELKSPGEIDAMRAAGRVVAAALAATAQKAAVGVRLDELDQIARDVLAEHGATSPFLGYQPSFAHTPFPAVICASVNDAALHGIPRPTTSCATATCSASTAAQPWTGGPATPPSRSVGGRQSDLRLIETACCPGGRLSRGARRAAGRHLGRHRRGRQGGRYGLHTDFGGHGVGHTMHESPVGLTTAGQAGRPAASRAWSSRSSRGS